MKNMKKIIRVHEPSHKALKKNLLINKNGLSIGKKLLSFLSGIVICSFILIALSALETYFFNSSIDISMPDLDISIPTDTDTDISRPGPTDTGPESEPESPDYDIDAHQIMILIISLIIIMLRR